MSAAPLPCRQSLPGFSTFSAATAGQRLDAEISAHRGSYLEALHRDGALVFRGYAIENASDYDQAVASLIPQLAVDNGEHRPLPDTPTVYRPVEYEASRKLLWHNENSYNAVWPLVISFCALRPATTGGETPVADSRKLLAGLDAAIAEEFSRRGVTYVRTYGFGLGRSWQEVFRTDSQAVLEARFASEGIRHQWRGEGLITHQPRAAVIAHPLTGERSFFAQPTHFHPYCLDADTRDALLAMYAEDELPRNCLWGDGAPISDAVMQHLLDVYQANEVSFGWQRGDVMVLDNALFAHARNPYSGPRELLVAMGINARFVEGERTAIL